MMLFASFFVRASFEPYFSTSRWPNWTPSAKIAQHLISMLRSIDKKDDTLVGYSRIFSPHVVQPPRRCHRSTPLCCFSGIDFQRVISPSLMQLFCSFIGAAAWDILDPKHQIALFAPHLQHHRLESNDSQRLSYTETSKHTSSHK